MTTGTNDTFRKQAGAICLLCLAALALYLCYLIARPFLGSLVISATFAIVFHPLHLKIKKSLRNSNAAATISTILVLLIVAVPLLVLGISVSGQLTSVIQSLQERTESQGGLSFYLSQWGAGLLSRFGNYVNFLEFDPQAALLRGAEQVSRYLLSTGAAAVSNLLSFALDTVVVFFSLFFFFREGESILRELGRMLPLDWSYTEKLFADTSKMMTATLYGGLAAAAVQGFLTGIAFGVLGVAAPIVWAVVTVFASLVPFVGSSLVWGPAGILLLLKGHWIKAVILLAWGAGVVGQIDAFVRPYVVGTQVKVHTLLIFFSLLGGIKAFGIAGIFIGPVILSITMAILDMLKKMDFSWKSTPQNPEGPWNNNKIMK
jgi:predicted PurR-regulated permease PerM